MNTNIQLNKKKLGLSLSFLYSPIVPLFSLKYSSPSELTNSFHFCLYFFTPNHFNEYIFTRRFSI